MTSHQERVQTERDELTDKITKLSKFISNPATSCTIGELQLLKQQLKVMQRYKDILTQRIVLHNDTQ